MVGLSVEQGRSPYVPSDIDAKSLGVQTDVEISAEVWQAPISNLADAQAAYGEFGAAILGPDYALQIGGQDVSVGEFTETAAGVVVDHLNDTEHGKAIRKKDYTAYNGTGRHLFTVSPENVERHLPEVLDWQRDLLHTVRAINRDSNTEVSIDPDEGTVINLQLFDPDGDEAETQQHGAHTDRVDTTTVVCLDNVGPHGELVFIKGYNAACESLGLSPHRNFETNSLAILDQKPEALTFRVHPVQLGTIVMLKTDEDVHFIVPKTLGDVKEGMASGHEVRRVGGNILGRGIINMAFETEACRKADMLARELERRHNLQGYADTNDFFVALEHALLGVDPEQKKYIANAIVTRRSAADLYQDL